MNPTELDARRERASRCNTLIRVIASVGRRFFHHSGRVARIEVDDRGRVWWHDEYSGKRIYTHQAEFRMWRGFTHGGTCLALVRDMRDYITRKRWAMAPGRFDIGPSWCRDRWGYGEHGMAVVYAAAQMLGVTPPGNNTWPSWVTDAAVAEAHLRVSTNDETLAALDAKPGNGREVGQ